MLHVLFVFFSVQLNFGWNQQNRDPIAEQIHISSMSGWGDSSPGLRCSGTLQQTRTPNRIKVFWITVTLLTELLEYYLKALGHPQLSENDYH